MFEQVDDVSKKRTDVRMDARGGPVLVGGHVVMFVNSFVVYQHENFALSFAVRHKQRCTLVKERTLVYPDFFIKFSRVHNYASHGHLVQIRKTGMVIALKQHMSVILSNS